MNVNSCICCIHKVTFEGLRVKMSLPILPLARIYENVYKNEKCP